MRQKKFSNKPKNWKRQKNNNRNYKLKKNQNLRQIPLKNNNNRFFRHFFREYKLIETNNYYKDMKNQRN